MRAQLARRHIKIRAFALCGSVAHFPWVAMRNMTYKPNVVNICRATSCDGCGLAAQGLACAEACLDAKAPELGDSSLPMARMPDRGPLLQLGAARRGPPPGKGVAWNHPWLHPARP